MKEITVHELMKALDNQENVQLIDVRELHENQLSNIGGDLIPMASIPYQIERISRGKMTVFYCRSGGRSANIIQWLENNYGFQNLYNLKGGLLAWQKEIDPDLKVF